ncbi:MAG: dimethyl sulfoxide reductase anchor subunit [Anaerolineae bacterium]|jgi:anaerobic dimethyl sulfoxide reductase subunit C|nr:dimethyl sulfoxide reductase anchor subunit [Anaerolineae bacterium]
MNFREWALIAFTIFAQMSVGAFLILGVVHYYASKKAGPEEADRLSDRALIAIGITLGLGMLASLFHLGSPLSAPRAVSNLATSWLSREILAGVIFALLGVTFAAMQWFKLSSIRNRNIVAWATSLVGLALIYSMARVYMLPTQPAWNTLATPLAFFVTTLLLGSMALAAAFVANYAYVQIKNPGCADTQCELLHGVLKGISVAGIVLMAIELIILPLNMGYLASGSPAALNSVRLMAGTFGTLQALRLVLVFIGAGVFGIFLYISAEETGKESLMGYLAYSAFALVFVAEVLGRMIFYASHQGIGL